jgi:hypothetical protein
MATISQPGPTAVVIEVDRALYDVPLLEGELQVIVQEVERGCLTDELHTRLHAMQFDLCMRLAFFRDRPEGFGKCPPGTLADMVALEGQIDAILDGIDAEVFAEV